ncbi:MAG: Nif3-like dinuclear metal center hexameric protein, partial [Muribaculaceae bacterium]|nr:Nif3-like dinuclear metal center hexameric protein [Muribaculaceae bacterium]
MTTIRQIIDAIEEAAPRSLQEQWDNSGLICGRSADPCSGVMVCLDVTPAVVSQAIAAGCNLIISHHPLIFKGIKALSDTTPQGLALIMAIKNDIAVYCAHTSLDNAPSPWGVSHEMAALLGAHVESVISPTGTGVIAELSRPEEPARFIETVKKTFGAECVRHSALPSEPISKVALGSGACGFLIPDAIAAGAQAIV